MALYLSIITNILHISSLKMKSKLKSEQKCFIQNCDNGENEKTKMYCIPQILNHKKKNLWKQCQVNKLRRETWIRNIGCESSTIPTKIYICEKHFVHGTIF